MPYRSAGAALADRERAIERELQHLLGPESTGVPDAARIGALNTELVAVRAALSGRNPERPLRRLAIRSGTKCMTLWDRMRGNERARACYECGSRVYNFSGLTSEEAYELLSQYERRPGKRLYRRADGTVLARSCPRPLQRALARHPTLLPMLASLIVIMSTILVLELRARSLERSAFGDRVFQHVLAELEAAHASRPMLQELRAWPRGSWSDWRSQRRYQRTDCGFGRPR